MSNLQTSWTERELLADETTTTPLMVAGYRCHGGFDDDGRYQSPRTRFRVPAIAAWQQAHSEQFGTTLLDVPLETWPKPHPNVAQSRYLLQEGVREPMISRLTTIGTVEGFGALIRYALVPDRQRFFVESIEGTAIEHLDRGLFEAHARDEAGWEEEYGHRHMWFAARDVAFEHPMVENREAMLRENMGIPTAGPAPDPAAVRERMLAARVFDDLDLAFEMMIQRMIGILLIEISAHHVFAWAEELLSDPDLVAGDGAAADLVGYIRQDEAPHVAYLATALTEMRDRTFVGESGRTLAGTDVIGTLWERGLAESLGPRREQNLKADRRELEAVLARHRRGDEILERFDALATEPVGVDREAAR